MYKENAVYIIYIYNIFIYIYTVYIFHILEYYLALKKGRNPSICNNMDKPGGHYVQGNKPATRRQIGYDFTYMKNQK